MHDKRKNKFLEDKEIQAGGKHLMIDVKNNHNLSQIEKILNKIEESL